MATRKQKSKKPNTGLGRRGAKPALKDATQSRADASVVLGNQGSPPSGLAEADPHQRTLTTEQLVSAVVESTAGVLQDLQQLACAIFAALAQQSDTLELSKIREKLAVLASRLKEAEAFFQPLVWEFARAWEPLDYIFCGIAAASPYQAIHAAAQEALFESALLLSVLDSNAHRSSADAQRLLREQFERIGTKIWLPVPVYTIHVKAMRRNWDAIRDLLGLAPKAGGNTDGGDLDADEICKRLVATYQTTTAPKHKLRATLVEYGIPGTTFDGWVAQMRADSEGSTPKADTSALRLDWVQARVKDREERLRAKEAAKYRRGRRKA